MGSRQQELQASVELMYELALRSASREMRPDLEYAKALILAAPQAVQLLREIVAAWARGDEPGEFGSHPLIQRFQALKQLLAEGGE